MTSKRPTIRIVHAWLVQRSISVHLNTVLGDGSPLMSDEECLLKVDSYKQAWAPLEQKILEGMTDILNLEFRQNVIDVYIAPLVKPISNPLMIGTNLEPDQFVDMLTHELLHRLLTDNTSIAHGTNLLPEWESKFGVGHSLFMIAHIPVHAVHEAIFLDVLGMPERLERDIDRVKKLNAIPYIEAWEYVQKHGYKHIIAQLNESYRGLKAIQNADVPQ